MLFRKKGKMIDIRQLQKKGVVRIPKEEIKIPQATKGFIDFKENNNLSPSPNPSTDLLGFMSQGPTKEKFSTEEEGYSKREVDSKITELDNKIYKLEQRIELLERKVGVENTQENTGLIGW